MIWLRVILEREEFHEFPRPKSVARSPQGSGHHAELQGNVVESFGRAGALHTRD
jgi:hypothetical protein